jgi:formylglycine-generating enzyme required for sulfatase activity
VSVPFDPYHQWLGIPPSEQPPHLYRLLGVSLFEADRSVIELAADRQMTFVRQHGAGVNGESSQKLLNEIAQALTVLLNPSKRKDYDADLRRRLSAPVSVAKEPASDESRNVTAKNLTPARSTAAAVSSGVATAESSTREKAGKSATRDRARERQEIAQLVPIAQRLIAKHDYGQAVQLLEQVAVGDRTPQISELLHEARELEEEAELLLADLRQSVHSRQLEGINDNLDRLLELKPGNKFARELRDSLDSYGGKGSGKRYQFDTRGNLLPADDGSWFEGARAAIVVGIVAFVAMSAAITIYLRDGRQSVAVEVDEELVKSGDLSLVVEGRTFEIKGVGEKILLAPGPHGYEVRRGDQIIAGPATYTVRKGEKNVLTISLPGPSPEVAAATPTPQPVPPEKKVPTLIAAPFDATRAKAYQAEWASYLGVPAQFTNSVGMKFVLIPPHQYRRGSSEEDVAIFDKEHGGFAESHPKDEMPQHSVTITKPYYLGQYEVTVDQFRSFVDASSYKTSAETGGGSDIYVIEKAEYQKQPDATWNKPGYIQTGRFPVVNVSWNDATAFCDWLSRKDSVTCRLPTEAEWEQSCRAGTKTQFCNGDTYAALDGYANVADASLRVASAPTRDITYTAFNDGYAHPAPAGSFRPNAFGLHDMHGNVWEWCLDAHDSETYKSMTEKNADDPKGPQDGQRCVRGGSWCSGPDFLRSAERAPGGRSDVSNNWVGFRVVLEIPQPPSR